MQERATYQLPVGTMKKRRRGVVRPRHRHHHRYRRHLVMYSNNEAHTTDAVLRPPWEKKKDGFCGTIAN